MTREDKLRKTIDEYIGYPLEMDEEVNTAMQRAAFADGANWQYHELNNKACEWLKENMYIENIFEYDEDEEPIKYVCISNCDYVEEVVEHFRKAMEE